MKALIVAFSLLLLGGSVHVAAMDEPVGIPLDLECVAVSAPGRVPDAQCVRGTGEPFTFLLADGEQLTVTRNGPLTLVVLSKD